MYFNLFNNIDYANTVLNCDFWKFYLSDRDHTVLLSEVTEAGVGPNKGLKSSI